MNTAPSRLALAAATVLAGLIAAACAEGPAGPGDAAALRAPRFEVKPSFTGYIKFSYVCGNTWQLVLERMPAASYEWEVRGTKSHGTFSVPATPGSAYTYRFTAGYAGQTGLWQIPGYKRIDLLNNLRRPCPE